MGQVFRGSLAGSLVLRPEQVTRHRVFRFYVEEFAYGPHANWAAFTSSAAPKFQLVAPGKSLAPVGSLLAQNIEQVLTKIRSHFTEPPRIQDVLLFLHGGAVSHSLLESGPPGFKLVLLDYSEDADGNLISFEF